MVVVVVGQKRLRVGLTWRVGEGRWGVCGRVWKRAKSVARWQGLEGLCGVWWAQRPLWMTVAGLGSQRGWKEMEGSGAARPAADGSDESAIRGHRLQGRHVVGVGAARTVGQQDGDR